MKSSLNRTTNLSVVLAVSLGIGIPGLMTVQPADAAGHHKLSDAQIAAIVVGADTVDINYGKLALRKSHDPAVRRFARQMVRDHSTINRAAVQLVTRLGVKPAPSDLSRTLTANAKKTMARLSSLHGKTFDRAYINNEVTYHKLVIKTAKTVLIPDAKNPELKQTLIKTAPTFVEHLRHAEMIQRQERRHGGMMRHGM